MIKKLRIILPIIFIAILAILFNRVFASLNFAIGNSYFAKQNWKSAAYHYKIALNIRPENPSYRDQYIMSLIKMPLVYDVQRELFTISKSNNSSPAVIEAYKRLEKFKENILSHFNDTYISSCSENSLITHWDEKKFPLKVYVKKNKNLTASQQKYIKKAFDEWDKAFKGFFKFEFTEDKNDANIFIDFDFALDENAKEDQLYVAAQTIPNIEGRFLKGMVITVNLFDNYGERVPDDQLYSTIFHEIGHALGITGHSSDYHDLMYIKSSGEITKRDIDTVKLLYLLVPDVTNTKFSDIDTTQKIYAPIIIGDDNDQDYEQYHKATVYINKSPDFSIGWSELGDYYYKIKDYPKAIKAFLKAKELARSDNEKAVNNYSLGIVYFTIKDYEHAADYLKKALEYADVADWKGLLGFSLVQCGKKSEGEKLMNEAFMEEPSNMHLGIMLADYYYTEGKPSMVIKILKILKKNNPDYKHYEEIRKYKILNLFVNNVIQNTQYSV